MPDCSRHDWYKDSIRLNQLWLTQRMRTDDHVVLLSVCHKCVGLLESKDTARVWTKS